MLTTPILLITFNRPDHVRQVLIEISKQQPTQLYVCQDGARKGNVLDHELVQQVRDVIDELVDWPCELYTLYHDKNLGCGPGPAAGISWFFEHVEMGIILEDDAVPHEEFFEYASMLLEMYKHDEMVRAIGSMKLYDEKFGNGSYYFSMMNRTLCAWATWRRAWKYFDYEMKQYSTKDLKNAMKRYGATLREIEYWQERLEEIHKDCLRGTSWDQQFWMTIWLTGGKGICPNSNLSTNIGFDEMGTHTTDSSNVGSCRALESILPIVKPTDTSIQREADLLFHKTYYAPYEYRWNGVKRIPYRWNKRIKRLFGVKGSWFKRRN